MCVGVGGGVALDRVLSKNGALLGRIRNQLIAVWLGGRAQVPESKVSAQCRSGQVFRMASGRQ